jgi:uncharacterized phage protein (TIGR01671 family)
MRELKFRVWDGEKFLRSSFGKKDAEFISLKIEGGILPQYGGLINYHKTMVVQQYTGLKDRNGKEIYEGDIFKGGDYKWDAVEFEDGQFQVNLMGARVFSLQELCCDIDYELPEVIGNIFENPELLE